jgi:GTP-binding protein HflX
VLAEIGAAEIPQIVVMNKVDRLPAAEAGADAESLERRLLSATAVQGNARSVAVSALTGAGVDRLLAVIDEMLPFDPIVHATFRLPAGDGGTLSLLHEFGRVIETRYLGEECEVEAEIPESLKHRLQRKDSPG